MQCIEENAGAMEIRSACQALDVPRASFYRWRQRPANPPPPIQARRTPRKLTLQEEEAILLKLSEDRFLGVSPGQVHAILWDEGYWICSARSLYRLLERRRLPDAENKRRDPSTFLKPRLMATAPNQVWCWDTTQLPAPKGCSPPILYVMLDVFSRYVVGWKISETETGEEAKAFIEHCCQNQSIVSGQLTIHSDRGRAMRSQVYADLLGILGISKTYSRPYTPNDNARSEACFRTLKYHPSFPNCFDSIEIAHAYLAAFFTWYNGQHRHSSLAMMTPSTVHAGRIEECWQQRRSVLLAAYRHHPERYVKGEPSPRHPPPLKREINKPQPIAIA